MKRILNNKLFVILALFIFFLLINTKQSYAMDSVLVTSETYNKTYIDSYLESGYSPFEAFKNIVDHYNEQEPGTIKFTSSDLPEYAVLIEAFDENGLSLGYTFYFTEYKMLYEKSTGSNLSYNADFVFDFEGSVPDYINCYISSGFNDGGFVFYYDEIVQILTGDFIHDGYTAKLIASNYDIISLDDGSTVFQQPTWRKVTTLASVVLEEKAMGTLQKTMKEIIVVLPIILVVIVGILAILKALKFLKKILIQG